MLSVIYTWCTCSYPYLADTPVQLFTSEGAARRKFFSLAQFFHFVRLTLLSYRHLHIRSVSVRFLILQQYHYRNTSMHARPYGKLGSTPMGRLPPHNARAPAICMYDGRESISDASLTTCRLIGCFSEQKIQDSVPQGERLPVGPPSPHEVTGVIQPISRTKHKVYT